MSMSTPSGSSSSVNSTTNNFYSASNAAPSVDPFSAFSQPAPATTYIDKKEFKAPKKVPLVGPCALHTSKLGFKKHKGNNNNDSSNTVNLCDDETVQSASQSLFDSNSKNNSNSSPAKEVIDLTFWGLTQKASLNRKNNPHPLNSPAYERMCLALNRKALPPPKPHLERQSPEYMQILRSSVKDSTNSNLIEDIHVGVKFGTEIDNLSGYIHSVQCNTHCDWTAELRDESCSGGGGVMCWLGSNFVRQFSHRIKIGNVLQLKNATISCAAPIEDVKTTTGGYKDKCVSVDGVHRLVLVGGPGKFVRIWDVVEDGSELTEEEVRELGEMRIQILTGGSSTSGGGLSATQSSVISCDTSNGGVNASQQSMSMSMSQPQPQPQPQPQLPPPPLPTTLPLPLPPPPPQPDTDSDLEMEMETQMEGTEEEYQGTMVEDQAPMLTGLDNDSQEENSQQQLKIFQGNDDSDEDDDLFE